MITPARVLILLLLAFARHAHACEFVFELPTDDRWHYPFNFTPGFRAIGSTFGAAELSGFNDRDAYLVMAWDTSEQVVAGLGPNAYQIESVTVTLTSREGAQWPVDQTVDEWFTYGVGTDTDPGRPLELFGAGFGPTYNAAGWRESDLFVGSDSETQRPRDPFPFVYQDGTGDILHVEDSVKGLHNTDLPIPLCDDPGGICPFTPIPWAIGAPIDYQPGNQPIPFDVRFDVNLDLSGGAVRQYFQQQLDQGRAIIVVSSMTEADFQGPQSGFPSVFMKEVLPFEPVAKAAKLSIQLTIQATGDFDQNGVVNLLDWLGIAACLEGPGPLPSPDALLTAEECLCLFDFDGDRDVDLFDASEFQNRVAE